MAWDYARLYWNENGGSVSFTCQEDWIRLPNQTYMDVLADLGAMGWELVSIATNPNVQGSSGVGRGETFTTSSQYLLFKRPWNSTGRDDYLQRLSSWFKRQYRIQKDRPALRLAEQVLKSGMYRGSISVSALDKEDLTAEERSKKRMSRDFEPF